MQCLCFPNEEQKKKLEELAKTYIEAYNTLILHLKTTRNKDSRNALIDVTECVKVLRANNFDLDKPVYHGVIEKIIKSFGSPRLLLGSFYDYRYFRPNWNPQIKFKGTIIFEGDSLFVEELGEAIPCEGYLNLKIKIKHMDQVYIYKIKDHYRYTFSTRI